MNIEKIKYFSTKKSCGWIILTCEVRLKSGELGQAFIDVKDDLSEHVKRDLFVRAYHEAIGKWGLANSEGEISMMTCERVRFFYRKIDDVKMIAVCRVELQGGSVGLAETHQLTENFTGINKQNIKHNLFRQALHDAQEQWIGMYASEAWED